MVLVALATLAFVDSACVLQDPPRHGDAQPPIWADATFSALRSALRPGERIGLFVPCADPDAEVAFRSAAQFALIPAIVEPVALCECFRPSAADCEYGALSKFALAGERDPALVTELVHRLALRPAGRFGDVLLLEQAPR